MNTRKNCFFHSFSTSTSRFMKKGRLARAGDLWPEKLIFMIHNLQNICSAGGLRGFSLNFLALKHLLLFLGITQQSTNRWIYWCQKDRIVTIQQLTLVLGLTRVKRGGPSLTHRPYPTANPAISIASVPRQRWVPNRGKQTAAPLSLKRRTRRECTVHANSPLKDIACVLLAQTKDAKIVCVSSGVK